MSFPLADAFMMLMFMSSAFNPSVKSRIAFLVTVQCVADMAPEGIRSVMMAGYADLESILDAYAAPSAENPLLAWVQKTYAVLTNTAYTPQPMYGNITSWSHPTWRTIHRLAAPRPVSAAYRKSYRCFITCLQFLLPCPACREHVVDNMRQVHIDTYDDLFLWSYDFHAAVTRKIGRGETITLDEARAKFQS